MKLNLLLKALDQNVAEKLIPQLSQLDIRGLAVNSKDVQDGFAFFAISGATNNGAHYIPAALQAGAKLIIYEHENEGHFLSELKDQLEFYQDCWFLAVPNARQALARAASSFWPNQPEYIVAITGTSGKTSTAIFTNQLWQSLGYNSASIGTMGVSVEHVAPQHSLTTPDTIGLHQILAELANLGVTHTVMEASSHGIAQYRLDNVRLSAAAFTNLGRDHLDYHIDIEDYFLAKMRLFEELLPKDKPVLLFADDKYSDKAIDHIGKYNSNILKIGRNGDFIQLKKREQQEQGQSLELEIDGRSWHLFLPLLGTFQLYNALMALAIVIIEGAPLESCIESMAKLQPVAGRMQLIGKKQNGALIYVDYAHKPEALEQLLKEAKKLISGQIILVFGCGGNRDKGKRAIMGAIAQQYSDIIIVTDDNPRNENAAAIRSQILQAAPKAVEIADRGQAIACAIDMAEKHDIVLVAGKGHETGQIIGTKFLPFSDQVEIQRCLTIKG